MKGNFKELSGQRFGRLKVIERVSYKSSSGYWRCKCDCGREVIVRTEKLTHGQVKSCGCLNSELITKQNLNKRSYKLRESDLDAIQDLHHRGYPDWQIAKELGCSRSLISLRIRELGIRNEHD